MTQTDADILIAKHPLVIALVLLLALAMAMISAFDLCRAWIHHRDPGAGGHNPAPECGDAPKSSPQEPAPTSPDAPGAGSFFQVGGER